eukprot:6803953-Alexandrium_andersonii.AAC.1
MFTFTPSSEQASPAKRLRRARRPFSSPPSDSARKTAQNSPLGSLGANFEVVPGPAQLKLRTPGAIS